MKSYCCFFLSFLSVVPAGLTSFRVVDPLSFLAIALRTQNSNKRRTAIHLRMGCPPRLNAPIVHVSKSLATVYACRVDGEHSGEKTGAGVWGSSVEKRVESG